MSFDDESTARRDALVLAMAARGKARRVELGHSVAWLALQLRCSRGRVYSLECYGAGSLATVLRWADALGMDPRVLIWGDDDK